MAHHCEFCGDTLSDAEEERSEELGFWVCEDCLNHGFKVLKRALGRHTD